MNAHTTTILSVLGLALGLTLASGWRTAARADGDAPPPKDASCGCGWSPCDDPPEGCPCPAPCLPDPLFRCGCLDTCIVEFQKAKAESCFKLGAGAYHWFHYDNPTGDLTYGYPNGGEGTYFFYLNADLACPRCNECAPQWGAHMQLRAREDTVFRSFFDDEVWFYEGYGSLDLPTVGKFKAGKVWKRFGYDWDGTFWGNVPYYDGMKLDPDYGVTWERTWWPGKRLEINAFAQFFVAEDGVNGSIAGADPESTFDLEEQTTFVARVQPRWRFDKHTSVALGLSGLFGNVKAKRAGLADDDLVQFAADLEFQWCGLKVFGEYAHSDGRQTLSHYVTGGPSDTYDDVTLGIEYKFGPFTPRVVYSHGDYENPGGKQDLLLVGGTVAVTSWLTLYLEYVNWTVQATGGPEVQFEDGFQLVFAWDV